MTPFVEGAALGFFAGTFFSCAVFLYLDLYGCLDAPL